MNTLIPSVETRPRPRFGSGELPAEYLPLNADSLGAGEQFGPLRFQISGRSHQHHVEHILKGRESSVRSDCLFPFEFWPLPRVLSQWRFGRLNEVISVRATREINFRPKPGEGLRGSTRIKSVQNQRGLCFGFFESKTENAEGKICMRATDTLLLANGCLESKLREAVSKAKAPSVFGTAHGPASILDSWTLRMRFAWPTEKWRNNIHTDEYAQSLGYERALVEGPAIVDVVCSFHESHRGPLNAFKLAWKYVGPLYEDLRVALLERPSDRPGYWSYLVCEFPSQVPGQCRAILCLELERQ
jgi:hypothetical protein